MLRGVTHLISLAIRLGFPAVRSPAWRAVRIFRREGFNTFVHGRGSRGTQNRAIPLKNYLDGKRLETDESSGSGERGRIRFQRQPHEKQVERNRVPLSARRTTIAPTPSAGSNRSDEDNHLLAHHHLHRPNIDMESFSRLKKKVKHRLAGSAPKQKNTGANVGGESVDSTGSRPTPEPHVVAGGYDQEGKEPNADGGQGLPMTQLPQLDESGFVSAFESVNDQERGEADTGEGGVEEPHSVTEGSEHTERKDIDGEKLEQVYPSPSTASIPYNGKSDST